MINNRIFKRLALSVLCLGLTLCSAAQSSYESVLERIDTQHQDCLDLGENMIACSSEYYKKVDSMLNVVYKAVLKDLANTEKTDLRNEQREWLTNRNNKFREIDNEAKKDSLGSMERMTAVEDKAGYVRERVDELIGKLK
jgi:uncharacterized protein YecT (DUF1311 family)